MAKKHCLPPKGGVRELTFAFNELYRQKKVPSKRDHTPHHDTSELIATSRQRRRTAMDESIGRHHPLKKMSGGGDGTSSRRTRTNPPAKNMRDSVGFNFNHVDRERRFNIHEAKLSQVRKNSERIERNVVGPCRFKEIQKSDMRTAALIRQRVSYYGKLQQRFERDRAMQLAAGV